MKTILIMAGGTGGHVFPGLAVADVLRERGWRVVWMGVKSGIEGRLVPPRGYDMRWVRIGGVRGKGVLALLVLPAMLLHAFWQSARAIFALRPDVVLGMGGYVAFPGGMMASLLARPLVIHEQNSVAGLANRVLAGIADRVFVGFPGTLAKGEWSGNPVRGDIAALDAPEARFAARSGPLQLLVVGGSLGARALNEALPKSLALMPAHARPLVVHQAGEGNLDALRAHYADAGIAIAGPEARVELLGFIDDMAARYARADLVICRAGAITVAELCAGGVASVLVPFPHAVDDHQSANARFLADRGAAILLPQPDLSAQSLAALIASLDRARLLDMARRARDLGKPDAARVVADGCIRIAGGGGA